MKEEETKVESVLLVTQGHFHHYIVHSVKLSDDALLSSVPPKDE